MLARHATQIPCYNSCDCWLNLCSTYRLNTSPCICSPTAYSGRQPAPCGSLLNCNNHIMPNAASSNTAPNCIKLRPIKDLVLESCVFSNLQPDQDTRPSSRDPGPGHGLNVDSGPNLIIVRRNISLIFPSLVSEVPPCVYIL